MYLNLQDGSTVVFAVACFWCQSFGDVSLMCVHIILIPFGLLSGHLFLERAAHSVDHMFSLFVAICFFFLFPVMVLRAGFGF